MATGDPGENTGNGQHGARTVLLVRKNTFKWSAMPQADRMVSNSHFEMEEPINLEQRIRRKVLRLVDGEETLADVYEKAAGAAKKKEEEVRVRAELLVRRTEKEKDESLIKILKRVN